MIALFMFQGIYQIKKLEIPIPEDPLPEFLARGTYNVKVQASSNGIEVACLKINFSLAWNLSPTLYFVAPKPVEHLDMYKLPDFLKIYSLVKPLYLFPKCAEIKNYFHN